MADDLLVGIGADVAEFQRDAQAIVAIARGLQQDIARALSGTEILPDLAGEARAAGQGVMAGLRGAVQQGSDDLRRDVATALVPTDLGAQFTRLADTVRAGTQNISTDLAREGHEAGRALVTSLASELPAVQQVLAAFTREASATLSGRLLTDLTPQGLTAGRQLVSGLRTAVQGQQAALRADIVGTLIPTTLAGDFTRLTTGLRAASADLSRALGAGGLDAGRELVVGLASGVSGADRVIAQLTTGITATLDRANLLGDLERQGTLAGTGLVRGVTQAITAGSTSIQRAVTASLVPANLPGQLATITTAVGREIGRITPLLSATGTTAGRALVASLGSELAQGTAVIVREFSRGAAAAVAGVELLGDLTPAGQRAGRQLVSGVAQVVNREGIQLRTSLATALVPTTVTGELARLTTSVTTGLRELPPLFGAAGRESGAAFTATLGTQLNESRLLLTGFAQQASAALTAALVVGDTAASGERAGRALAGAIATGVAAEAPRVRAALSSALLPAGVTADVGRVVEAVKAEAVEIVPAFGAAGRSGGAALAEGIIAGLAPVGPALRRLTQGETIGVVIDATPIRAATVAQQELLGATEATAAAMKDVNAATKAIDPRGTQQAAQATRTLADAQREWLREARGASVEAQSLWQRQRDAAFQAGQAAKRNAADANANAKQEAAARAQVRAELVNDITTLQRLGAVTDATNVDALAGWRAEAAAIRKQAQDVGLVRDQMLRLDAVIQRTEASFARQAAAAARAAGAATGPLGPQLGPVLPPHFTQDVNEAKRNITQLTIGGKTLDQTLTRLGPAMIGVGFGLEALARGGTAADAGLRTALRSVASFAAFFGPKGLIVAGAAAGTAAILDLFSKTREEIKKTRDDFIAGANQMLKSVDVKGLRQQLEDLSVGVPDILKGGALSGGAIELSQQLEVARRRLQELENLPTLQLIDPRNLIALDLARINVEALKARLIEAQDQTRQIAQALTTDPRLQAEAKRLAAEEAQKARETAARAAEQAIRAEQEQVRALVTTYAQLNGDAEAQSRIVASMLPIYNNLATRAAKFGTSASDAAIAVREMKAELEEIEAVQIQLTLQKLGGTIPNIPPVEITGLIEKVIVPPATTIEVPVEVDAARLNDGLRRAIDQLSAVRNQQTFARIFGTRQQVADATENVNIVMSNLRRTFEAAVAAEMASADADTVKAQRLATLASAARDLGLDIQGLTSDANAAVDAFSDIAGAVNGISAVAREIRGVDEELLRVLDSAGRFASALSDLSQIKLTGEGGIFESFGNFLKSIPVIGEAIGSAIRFGRTAFDAITGKAVDDANNAITRENTEALTRLAQDLAGYNNNLAQLFGASRAIQESAILNARRGTSGFGRGFRDVEGLDAELRAAGSSIAILKRRAEELGITIVDAKGRISAQGLDALNTALKIAAAEAANFGDSLQDLRTIQDARREIFDVTGAGNAFRDVMAQIQEFAPELFEKFLAGVDVDTAEGRRMAEQAIRDLFDFIVGARAAGIDLTPFLDGFESVEDFVSTIVDADRALDELAETTRRAVGEVVNIAQGFAVSNRAFKAITADLNARQFVAPSTPYPTPLPVGAPQPAPTTVNLGLDLALAPVSPTVTGAQRYAEIRQQAIEKARARGPDYVAAVQAALPA